MSGRRGFLKSMALGGAGLLGRHWWGTPDRGAPLDLAVRVVQAAGAVGLAWPVTTATERTVTQLLTSVFGSTSALQDAAQLSHAQLQQRLAQRIQQDYQKADLVQHRGWWLAASEAAILELGCRLGRTANNLGQSAWTGVRRARWSS